MAVNPQAFIPLTIKDGHGVIDRQVWLRLTAEIGVPSNWPSHEAARLNPQAVLRGVTGLNLRVAGLLERLPAGNSASPPIHNLLRDVLESAQSQGCGGVWLPLCSPLDMLTVPERRPAAPSDDDLLMFVIRLFEYGISIADTPGYPERLFEADGDNYRMLTMAAYAGACSVTFCNLYAEYANDNRSRAARSHRLANDVLTMLGGLAGKSDQVDAYRSSFFGVWNVLMQEHQGLVAAGVCYLQEHDLLRHMESKSAVRGAGIRLRILADQLLGHFQRNWHHLPGTLHLAQTA